MILFASDSRKNVLLIHTFLTSKRFIITNAGFSSRPATATGLWDIPVESQSISLSIYSICPSLYLIYVSIYPCMYRKGHSYLWWYCYRLCCSPRAWWGHLLPDPLLYTLPFSCGGICWQPTHSIGPYGGWAGCSYVMWFCGLIMWVSCD